MQAADETVLNHRWQVSIPAALRKRGNLAPGQRLSWRSTGVNTFAVTIVGDTSQREVDALSAIGCAKRFSLGAVFVSTDEAMASLREGEE